MSFAHRAASDWQSSLRPPDSNPFATRWVRPGQLPYVFPDGDSNEDLLRRLEQQRWWGQIVGPHGSGKTTLLTGLLPALQRAGRVPLCFTLKNGQRRLPCDRAAVATWNATSQVVVDGYEQLSWRSRHWLRRACHRQGAGLLVTTHRPLRLPVLYCTQVSDGLVDTLVDRLLAAAPHDLPAASVQRARARHQDNVRELFFELYDEYERHAGG